MPAQGQTTESRHDLEVQQRRRAEFFARQEGTQLVRPVDRGQRIDHRRAVDDDHERDRACN